MDNNELKALFNDFKNQVDEISQHSDKVKKLDFNCTLLNGTGFKFNYDISKYNKKTKTYKPATTFNAIVDILSTMISITFLVLFLSHKVNLNFEAPTFSRLLIVTLFSFLIGFYVLRAIYHLFHASSLVRNPLFRVSEAVKLVILLNINFLVAVLFGAKNINVVIFTSFILIALALLCMGIGTKLAFKIEMFFTSLLPFLMLIGSYDFSFIFCSIILSISSFIYIILGDNEAKTNSIFMLLGISLLAINLFSLI